jgi:epoxyqueuosine reductase
LLQDDGPFPHEYRTILGDRIYGCDDCQEVCPPNRRAGAGAGPDGSAVGGGTADADGAAAGPTADLLDMLAATDEELLARYGRWYVPRRQARYLRRNALVVLGNVGDPGDAATLAALARALGDPDPVVRGHAVWAARRLGRDDLLAPVAADGDPLVRAELEAPVEPIVARRGSSP